jgi:hypothetical protein
VRRGFLTPWRRYRARRFLGIGEEIGIRFETPTAGPVQLVVRFTEQGDTLDMEIQAFYGLEAIKGERIDRADVGIREMIKGLDLICRRAADAGYRRLHAHGVRSGAKEGFRSIDIDLDRRGRRPRRRR